MQIRNCERCNKEFRAKKKKVKKCDDCKSYRNCLNCKTEFVSLHQNHLICDNCNKHVSIPKFRKECVLCKKNYMSKNEDSDKCESCYDCYIFKCKECKQDYVSRKQYYSSNLKPVNEYCQNCDTRRKRILNDKPLPEDHKCKFRIVLRYEKIESEDDSYFQKKEKTIVRELPLIVHFNNSHIDREGNVTINSYMWPLSYYDYMEDYNLMEARVIKNERLIDLDN